MKGDEPETSILSLRPVGVGAPPAVPPFAVRPQHGPRVVHIRDEGSFLLHQASQNDWPVGEGDTAGLAG